MIRIHEGCRRTPRDIIDVRICSSESVVLSSYPELCKRKQDLSLVPTVVTLRTPGAGKGVAIICCQMKGKERMISADKFCSPVADDVRICCSTSYQQEASFSWNNTIVKLLLMLWVCFGEGRMLPADRTCDDDMIVRKLQESWRVTPVFAAECVIYSHDNTQVWA